jgi:hypothetical protein
MSKRDKNNVTILDCYSGEVYEDFALVSSPLYKKNRLYIATLRERDFTTGQVEADVALEESDLYDYLEMQVAEKLFLEHDKLYLYGYKPIDIGSMYDTYAAYVIERGKVFTLFKELSSRFGHIDLIVPESELYRVLYEEQLSADKVDIFVHLEYENSYLTIYRNGAYLYTKVLDFGVEEFYTKFKLYLDSPELKLTQFYEVFSSGHHEDILINIIDEFYTYFEGELIYAARIYGYGELDRIYIGSDSLELAFFRERIAQLMEREVGRLHSLTGDQNIRHFLMERYAKTFGESKANRLNFTLFKKEPFFNHTKKFLLVLFASLLISALYPGWIYFSASLLQQDNAQLSATTNQLKAKISQKLLPLNDLKTVDADLSQKISVLQKSLNEKKKELSEVAKFREEYFTKSDTLYYIVKYINKYDLVLSEAHFDTNIFKITLFSDSEKAVTHYVNDLSRRYRILNANVHKEAQGFKTYIEIGK